MKTISARITTTHVDSHGERMPLEALSGIVEVITSEYLPMGVEHDPRLPPVGRVVDAKITVVGDGEFAVDATVEIFEEGDKVPFGETDRRAHVYRCDSDAVVLSHDRAFRDDTDQSTIAELAEILSAERRSEVKKSHEAIAILTFALKAAGGGSAATIGKKLTEAAWNAAVPKLKRLFSRKRPTPAQLFVLSASIDVPAGHGLVEVIVTDPTSGDLDSLKPSVLADAVADAHRRLSAAPHLVRFVYDYETATGLRPRYCVASNGIPIPLANPNDHSAVKGLSIGG